MMSTKVWEVTAENASSQNQKPAPITQQIQAMSSINHKGIQSAELETSVGLGEMELTIECQVRRDG